VIAVLQEVNCRADRVVLEAGRRSDTVNGMQRVVPAVLASLVVNNQGSAAA
jgi:hypothetical protein